MAIWTQGTPESGWVARSLVREKCAGCCHWCPSLEHMDYGEGGGGMRAAESAAPRDTLPRARRRHQSSGWGDASPPPAPADPDEDEDDFVLYVTISICLVLLAGLMSGLTLGLMSLDLVDLEVRTPGGQRRTGCPPSSWRAAAFFRRPGADAGNPPAPADPEAQRHRATEAPRGARDAAAAEPPRPAGHAARLQRSSSRGARERRGELRWDRCPAPPRELTAGSLHRPPACRRRCLCSSTGWRTR